MVKLLLLFSISSLNTDDKHFPYCLLKIILTIMICEGVTRTTNKKTKFIYFSLYI